MDSRTTVVCTDSVTVSEPGGMHHEGLPPWMSKRSATWREQRHEQLGVVSPGTEDATDEHRAEQERNNE